MAHHHLNRSGYNRLVARLNRFPQGVTKSEHLEKILSILFSETEKELVSLLPIKPFTSEKAAKIWKMPLKDARKVLDELSGRALLIDFEKNGKNLYVLPPPMAGFFEFSLMRIRDDIDQKALSELFYQYMNVEKDFIRELFTEGETRLGRTFVNEAALNDENALHVLDYEKATEVIKTASHIGISTCYCRHKMTHMGKACGRPLEICMTFNTAAASLIKHGHARKVEVPECLDLLDKAKEENLVQFGENVRERVSFICNCCGCCCEAMVAARRFAVLNPVHTTNFLPKVDPSTCNGCGRCVSVCPVASMMLISSNNPKRPKEKIARVDEDTCLGCGLCVQVCKQGSIVLERREKRVITPLNSAHKAVVMAIERGKLHHLIFDNLILWDHRALNVLLGVILNLPPVKQMMASQQVKSRFMENLVKRFL